MAASHPDLAKGAPGGAVEMLSLHDAQLVIAREYGFATWAQLKAHIQAHTAMTPIGSTAFVAAVNRALETELRRPLYRDPFARELAGEDMWAGVRAAQLMVWPGRFVGPEPYLSITTRFFDDALQRVVRDQSITQIVMLGAGMDTRAFRLRWPADVVFFEVDRDEVLERKQIVLRRLQAKPICDRRVIRADLTRSWHAVLLKAGFDPRRKAAILAEGLFIYLEAMVVRRVFETLKHVVSPGSWIGCDITSADTLASPMMTSFLEKLKRLGRPPWRFVLNDPESFMAQYGWAASSIVCGAPEANYGRWPYAYIPRGEKPALPRAFLVEGWMKANANEPV
jgi:methyltransferase (TIGR00027 family)